MDFWRVQELQINRFLRLKGELKLPGKHGSNSTSDQKNLGLSFAQKHYSGRMAYSMIYIGACCIRCTYSYSVECYAHVQGARSFYALRFLLGLAEAGFFPGMMLYLTYWFPRSVQALSVARFMTATAISGVIGAPISGLLLGLDNVFGLRGWQWLFLIEGLPAVVLGAVVLRYLTDRPDQAEWLTEEERSWLSQVMAEECLNKEKSRRLTVRGALLNGRVWRLAALYFLLISGFYGVNLWLPQVVKSLSTMSDVAVAFSTAVPFLVAAFGPLRWLSRVGSFSLHPGQLEGFSEPDAK